MTAKAAETAAPFAEATCRALTTLVLRVSGLKHGSKLPEQMVGDLRELAATDPALARWARAVNQRIAEAAHPLSEVSAGAETIGEFRDDKASEPSESSGESESHANWPTITASLPELLVLHGPPAPTDASETAWEQLHSVCHLALRLRTLETRFADELLRHKREAIYQFAYGLSHELNNPLANIATRGGVLAEQETHPQRKILLEAIVTNAMRGCEMLGDLMLVARPPQLTFKSTRIDTLVASVVAAAQLWAKNLNVDLKLEVHSKREVTLDAAALREALWALIRNALEAMFDGGTITVSVTDCDPVGRTSVRSDPWGINIEICDQGSGLSQAALEHCFDPYYSGREAGRGLGLGLSKAQRIVELHRGQLTLANRAGEGVVACIALPIG